MYLHTAYTYLDNKMRSSGGTTFGGYDIPRASDAMMFSHIMEVRNNAKHKDLIEPYSALCGACCTLLNKYFTSNEARSLYKVMMRRAHLSFSC